jgi:hypothetical protein
MTFGSAPKILVDFLDFLICGDYLYRRDSFIFQKNTLTDEEGQNP